MEKNHSVLSRIHCTDDVRALCADELEQLCVDIRQQLIDTVSHTGGHLSSNLGVVELTVALHHNFCLPHDQIVWDVGHQCYAHKLLTGRAERFSTLRQECGISGFPRPEESDCDTFVVGHASTSVSAANGMAKAKALLADDGYVIAVIGDGALTGGLAYEGLSNAGRSKDRLIVVLNDNQMSINANVGFVARHLAVLRARPRYLRFKNQLARLLRHIPFIGRPLFKMVLNTKLSIKRTLYKNSSWFEQMGYYYLGPIDGHNLSDLQNALQTAKEITGPVLLHVKTKKGKGYAFAEKFPDRFHGISPFDVESGESSHATTPTFSSVFGDTMCTLAKEDARICAITAAMTDGTGLETFAKHNHKRCFDVGIAEEHAVTFASGLAKNDMLPVFAVYSPFLQRCYDQLINDTALNGTHIVLAIDRAGVVPDDGETHQGIFDVPFLSTVPNTTIYAPATLDELRLQLRLAIYETDGIAAVRYPKGEEWKLCVPFIPTREPYTLWDTAQATTLVVTYGRMSAVVSQAIVDKSVALMKLNRIHPIDACCYDTMMHYSRILFVEECSEIGSISQITAAHLLQKGYRGIYRNRVISAIPTTSKVQSALVKAGLDSASLSKWIDEVLCE